MAKYSTPALTHPPLHDLRNGTCPTQSLSVQMRNACSVFYG